MTFPGRTDTSRRAAVTVAPKTGTQRHRVLTVLAASVDGLTDSQIQAYLNLYESSERPRRVELVAAGLVADSGRRRCYGGHGEAIVWELTDAGRNAATGGKQT
jgi:hypothetical protein